jgi:threonine dehydrogenase-like Zn-dependent dehydrogenase
MKAVRKMRKGKGNVELVEVPMPKIGPTDVLMKVWAAGVCGSDLNIEADTHFYRAPVTLGHEYSGVVVEAGQDVRKVKVGDKIVSDIEAPGGWLGVELDGSYASHMRIPESVVHVCPPEMSLDAAALVEPATGGMLHCLQERNTINAGDFVLVIGPGPMGILAVQFAKIRGARAVALVGLRDDTERLAVGRKVGADHVFVYEDDPLEKIRELSRGGADFVADCAGTQTGTQLAIDAARPASTGRAARGAFDRYMGPADHLNFDKVAMGRLDLHSSWSWNGRKLGRWRCSSWPRALDYRPDHPALQAGGMATAFANLRAKRREGLPASQRHGLGRRLRRCIRPTSRSSPSS